MVRSGNKSQTLWQQTEKQLQVLGTAVQEHMVITERKQGDALQRKKELESPDDESEDEDGGAQRTLAIQQIDERLRLLEIDQAVSKVVSHSIAKLSIREASNEHSTYNTTFAGSNNGVQVVHSTGTINWNASRT